MDQYYNNLKENFFQSKIIDDGNSVKITNFPVILFKVDLKRHYKTIRILRIFDQSFQFFGKGTIVVHKFFLPEFVYILNQLRFNYTYYNISNLILEQTWMKNTIKNFSNKIDYSRINNDLTFNLKSYQKEFLNIYNNKKQKYMLNGYILAFEQGLGKTFTSLALMHGLRKNVTLIIAPKQTLRTVWLNEINKIYKTKQNIWVVGDKPKQANFYIVNYESMNKIENISQYLKGKNIGIVVNEIHNFRNAAAQRVLRLLAIAKYTKCKDMILMSGTPIKALGSEMIPILQMLDPLFDNEALIKFKKVFGLSITTALDILKNRMGIIMHRKMKKEVIKLPDKIYKTIKIKIPNGKDYTLDVVKKQTQDYIKERKIYYNLHYNQYRNDYEECINYVREKLKDDTKFKFYLQTIDYLKKYGYNRLDKVVIKQVAKANKYEKTDIRPLLPSNLKKKFDKSKAVVKYVDLKIMGEVIGGLLNQLRSKMFSEMINHSPLCEIINQSIKKAICFTTFVDVAKNIKLYVDKECNNNSEIVFGETSGNITNILDKFKNNSDINPLIATIQTLSTGVTLVEADTVIFINEPWRSVDKSQAEDRIHRIGQDTEVKIYTFVLDTGADKNLSTRMSEIVQWSKDMFEGIVGIEPVARFLKKSGLISKILK